MDRVISLLNPWWRDGRVSPELRKDFQRDAFGECWRYMKSRQTVALTGLRRVGKTTLMYQIMDRLIQNGTDPEDIFYFSFDEKRESIREVLDAYASLVGKDIEKGRHYIFLDEVQKHAGWTDELKLLYDALPNLKFVVSGSAALQLERRGRESLAGRIFFIRLEPLSFYEWLRLRGLDFDPRRSTLFETNIKPRLLDYMSTPFPEIVTWKGEPVRRYIRETIVERAMYRDIPQEFGGADHSLLEDLLGIFFSNPGSYLNVDSLAGELGRSKLTIRNHIHYLRFSFLIRILGNYRGSRRSSSRKMRRIYPYCPALAAGEESELSKRVENLVISSLDAVSYWRERNAEVDAVWDGLPIEVKYRDKLNGEDLKGLRTCMGRLRTRRGLMVTKDNTSSLTVPEGRIDLMPAWELVLKAGLAGGRRAPGVTRWNHSKTRQFESAPTTI